MKMIKSVYVYTIVEPGTKKESVVVANVGGEFLPLFGNDLKSVQELRDIAVNLALESGCDVCLKKFSGGELMDIITPRDRYYMKSDNLH